MTLANRMEILIKPAIEAMGYDLVRAALFGDHDKTLQVMAERRDGRGMTVDDCAEISARVSAILDADDPIAGAYNLEVSSPGLDRPLVREKDYERFAGLEARIEMSRAVGGRKKFKGKVLGLEGALVKLRVGGAVVELPFADIDRAKLVPTDELPGSARQSLRS